MKKNVVQDVLPPKKSIRNVEMPSRTRDFVSDTEREYSAPAPKSARKSAPKEDPFTRSVNIRQEAPLRIEPADAGIPPISNTPPSYKYDFDEPKEGRSKKVSYIIGFITILVLAFGISALFRSAQIKIAPREEVKTLNDVFVAKKDISPNNLGFQVVSITKDVEKTVDSIDTSGSQKVEKKSQGKIIIYNNFGSEPQKLVATTRFQTPEGLIFRITSAVTIPGKTVKDGKTIPGSVEADVEADKVGPSYNIGLKDFTIPGLKGDPKYKAIYARSKTEMTGGFSGVQKVVNPDVLTKLEKEMEDGLKNSLSNDLVNQIPADFILFPSGLTYKYDSVTQTALANGNVVLKKKGQTMAVIFDKSGLSKAIQAKVLPEALNSTVKIANLDKLVFAYASSTSVSNSTQSISFTLSGSPDFVWVVDENKLKTDLLGLSKTSAKSVIASYSSVKEAWILTRPFWNQNIPSDAKKVTIINTLNP